ncbi:MAG TPA: transcription termination factor NusA [Candidatus Spyradosoma merdigallinarum]|uniref:Transcription termination/antitermination protein NusA n=1 Tax=Candidatus Spyradosoma merdigallinarum TaxID=2840950 RepID=A0A9D1NJX5_9BACT|nr:transcription termination factor NusA [Candidatus Spyradosoma merdigallinarum]
MNNEIISVFEYLEKEKGVSRERLIPVISEAIKNASEKGVNAGQQLKIDIDPRTGDIRACVLLTVVDSVADPKTEIHVKQAALYADNPQLGDVIEKEIRLANLGRIVAQTVQQTIMQWIRQDEKDRLYSTYKDQVGMLVAGTVRRRERGDLIVELGKAEATLPRRETCYNEDFQPGDHITCLLKAIETTPRGPEIILSRADPLLVRRMLEREVTEISDGSVVITGIARDPGNRTKIAVDAADPKVDPVGACVGARGSRVRNLVKELNNEKIDIIRYMDDPADMLREAIKPAVPRNVQVDEAAHRIYFEVTSDDMSVALGRHGQNAKLTSKLLGWRLDIGKVDEAPKHIGHRIGQAVSVFANIPGIPEDVAKALVDRGFTDLQVFEDAHIADDLVDAGFAPEDARLIVDAVKAAK